MAWHDSWTEMKKKPGPKPEQVKKDKPKKEPKK